MHRIFVSAYLIVLFLLVGGPVRARQTGPILQSTLQGVAPSQPVQASSSTAFLQSIGVNTHWSYPSYSANAQQLQSLLIGSGIQHIRDGVVPSAMAVLSQAGIKEDLLLYPPAGIVPNLTYWSGASAANTHTITDALTKIMPAGSVDSVEMPNELDVFYATYKWHATDTAPLSATPGAANFFGAYGQAVTQDCWTIMKANPSLTSIPIIGPTVGVQVPSPYAADSLYKYVDFGGFHPYPGRANTWTYPQPYDTIAKYYWDSFEPSVNIGNDPYGGNPLMFTWYQPPFMAGSTVKAMFATETGYMTAPGAQGAVSTTAQAKYMPRLFAEYFRNGIARTFSYELYDEGTDPTNREDNFGLIFNNLTPKPALTALTSLIKLLQDTAGSFVPQSLGYSLTVQPNGAYNRTAYVHDLLLQKSAGDFYLLLWHEVSDSSDTSATGAVLPGIQRDLNPPALTTTIALPSSVKTAQMYSYNSLWTLQPLTLPIISGQIVVPVSDTVSVIRLQ